MISTPTLPPCPVFGMFMPVEQRVVAHVVRRVAVRHLNFSVPLLTSIALSTP